MRVKWMKNFDISKMKLGEIKQLAEGLTADARMSLLTDLKTDERSGVQKYALQLESQIRRATEERERMKRIFSYETEAWSEGFAFVAGLDEAGRGPLVGPVVAAAVILDPKCDWTGIDDSKKLSAKQRDKFFDKIIAEALFYGVGQASHEEIDSINILQATKLAMKRAISAMGIEPDYLLIDAVKLADISIKQTSLIKGDSKSASIAAASILAKVTRDRMLEELDLAYPQYGFSQHKGYGTKVHYEAIAKYGIIAEHRRSFLKGIL